MLEDDNVTEEPTPVPFPDRVNSVVTKMTQGEDGTWTIPDDIDETDEAVLYAAKLEKRHRDTQSAYTKSQKRAKELETVNERLTSHMVETATLHLSDEQREELDELKLREPDEWRTKLDQYEKEAKTILANKISEFQKEGEQLSEMELRQAKLKAFTETTGITLNDTVIESDLPAAYSKQLEKGEITFDEFLEKAQKFLGKGIAIKDADTTTDDEPDLSKVGGGSEPSKTAITKDTIRSYDKEIY